LAQLRATDSKWPEPRPDTPIWTCRNSGRRCAPNRKNAIGAIAFFLLSALYILLFAFVVPQAESRGFDAPGNDDALKKEVTSSSVPSTTAIP